MARPKLASGKKRTAQLAIRLLPSEAKLVRAAAGTEGFSAWARRVLLAKTVDGNSASAVDSARGH
jgi:hypothetical protein